jgi:centromere/kinetochore protein ZW10
MASYLSQVLSSVEEITLVQINNKYPEVEAVTARCKDEVLSFLENIYVRFSERPRQNKVLANKLNQLQDEISVLITDVEKLSKNELTKAEAELSRQLDSLTRVNIGLSLVSILYTIHESLCIIKESQQKQSYLYCMEKIQEVECFMSDINFEENLAVVEELKLTLATEKSSLLNNLSNLFSDHVICIPVENKSVMKVMHKNEQMKEVLSALYLYKTSVTQLDNVTRFLWNHIFVPVVDVTTEIKTNVEGGFVSLEVITVDPNKKSSYAEVFANIKIILSFLLANFNIILSEEFTTLSYIGRDIRDNLSELLIKHCLQDTIPSTNEGLQQYNVVIKATEDLEKALVLSKIFADDTISILDYANKVDVLFINKKCQNYVISAQNLMKKDLHDLVEVGENREASFEVSREFPRCAVSRSVLDLQNLLEKILSQAVTSSEVCAGRFFCTVKTICHKYVLFVPEHHKKLLQTIPQQIALFYNNCMYIAHKLTEWNDTYLKQLPSMLNIKCNSFNDEGCQLCEIAAEKFNSYVQYQIKQIEEIMKDAALQRQTLEQVKASTDKCLRQCLRQQELLKTVWCKVLPYAIYNKTLGSILDSMCKYLINAVVRFDDISSDAAEQLVELFKMVQTRGPKLFTDPKEVNLFVESWYKLNELAFVLNASLLDINDRWADGKGPLGLQFRAEELKQLVRALFQNTERRAALLSKIHE